MAKQTTTIADGLNYQSIHTKQSFKETLRISVRNNKSLIKYGFIVMAAMLFCIPALLNGQNILQLNMLVLFVLFACIIGIYLETISTRRTKILQNFAKDNRLTYNATKDADRMTTILSEIGKDHTLEDVFTGTLGGRRIKFGNYTYTIGSGDTAITRKVGFAQIQLENKVPNVFIDSKLSDRFGGVSVGNWLNDCQVISLEGNFDAYFTVYAPKGFERDTLYFLTPELMAMLIDVVKDYDIELIDKTLRFFAPDDLQYDEENIRYLLSLVELVGNEFIENTRNYILR